MFEMIPDAAVVMFARLPQGDGVFLWNSSAQDEVVEKKKKSCGGGEKKNTSIYFNLSVKTLNRVDAEEF